MTPKSSKKKEIPLVKALANPDRPQATPLDVFKLARKFWLEGKRISIGDLAKGVGVSRVTLYRWVESKDRLVEEVLWSFAKPTFENAVNEAVGSGVEHVVDVHRRFLTALGTFEPMRRFISDNPKTAIRIQTNDPRSAHGRIIEATTLHLSDQIAKGRLKLAVPVREVAEMIVFTGGALLYSAIIGGRSPMPAIEQSCTITRMLMQGKFVKK